MPGGVWRLKRRDYLMKSLQQRKYATFTATAFRLGPDSGLGIGGKLRFYALRGLDECVLVSTCAQSDSQNVIKSIA
jgi:hypothetical protein